MLSSIFSKTIYDKRWALFGWGLGTFILVVFVVSFFHSLSGGQFDQTLKDLPSSLEGLYGAASSYANINGFLNQQEFVRTMPILGSIFAILVFTGILAGEEGEGTLQVLLTQPVSRAKVLVQKLIAGAVLAFGLCVAVFLGCLVGVALIGEHTTAAGVAAACFSLWLIIMTFGSFAYMIGAITGKRGLAGGLAGIIAFASYLITSLSVGISSLQTVDKFSPYHYYGSVTQNPISNGLTISHVLVLVGLTIVFSLIALIVFQKRDIYQA